MRTMMLITICVLMTMTMAKSEETVDVKVKNFLLTKWEETKTYQAEQWQNGKEQTINNLNKIKSLFGGVKNDG